MKKWIALLLALVMLLSLAACGDKEKDNDKDSEKETTLSPEEAALTHEFDQFGKGRIKIVGTELDTDEDDETFLRIFYDYTNTSDSAAGQDGDALNFTLTQNGEELEDLVFWSPDDEGCIADDLYTDLCVQPGVTVRRTALYYCDPEGGVIDVSCYLMVGSWAYNPEDVQAFTFRVDPTDLMGAPKPFEIKTIAETGYTKGLSTSGTTTAATPYTVSLDGYELTTCDDQPALRVKLTYTNLADKAWPPCVPLGIEAYQDGISLEWGDTWYVEDLTEEDEAFEEDLEPQETVKCSAIFILRGTSVVDVVVEDVDLRIGITCDVSK